MTYVKFLPGQRLANRTASEYTYNPPVDIVEDAETYKLEFDVPGFKRESIKVTVNEGVLSVTGERKREVEETDKFYRYFERPEGTFNRSFRLPEHADADNINAEFSNGVLRLTIPKKEEAKPHTIEIK